MKATLDLLDPPLDPHVTYLDFAARAGDYLGYGRGERDGERAWTKKMQNDIRDVISDAQRMVHKCVGLPAEYGSHSWGWLRPTRQLTLPSGADTLLLPRDFGGQMEGPVVVSAGTGLQWTPLRLMNWSAVRQMRAIAPDVAGAPTTVALEPVEKAGSAPQRWKLIAHPTADRDYALAVNYRVVPSLLSDADKFHYGGPEYSDLFLAGLMYAAELFKDNSYRGPRMGFYVDTLVASVQLDRRAWPKHLGLNGDNSDLRWRTRNVIRLAEQTTVTVSGLTPE